MQRLKPGIRVLATVAAVCSIGALSAPSALAQSLQYQSVRNVRGSITGVVSDDHGGPIAGAMVSALGTVTVAKAITDATGFFSIDALPIGDYTLQAHRTGFLGSSRATVRVERPLARACSVSSSAGSTARLPRPARRPRFLRGRSWPRASVCLKARSPISPTPPRRRRTRPSRATIIRTTKQPGGSAISSAAS